MSFLNNTYNCTYGEISPIGFCLENLLTNEECKKAIELVDNSMVEIQATKSYRNMDQTSIISDELTKSIWMRIKDHIPSNIIITADNEHLYGPSFKLHGSWNPIGLNNFWRFSRYQPGGHFSAHRDGFYQSDLDKRSLFTFMIYLNDEFTGGITRFLPDDLCSIKSNIDLRFSRGTAIIFPHNFLHEGTAVEGAPKYILRSDIMFNNCTISSSIEHDAFNLVQEASKAEAYDSNEAAQLYRKAFRLCPEIEKYV